MKISVSEMIKGKNKSDKKIKKENKSRESDEKREEW